LLPPSGAKGEGIMARKQHPECGACDHRLMVDIDWSGEYGVYKLYGCKRPTSRKFTGSTPFGCADYSGPEKKHKFNIVSEGGRDENN